MPIGNGMGGGMGLKAKVEAAVDRQSKRRVTSQVEEAIEDAEASVSPGVDTGGIASRTQRGGGRGGGGTAAAGGVASRMGGAAGAAKMIGTVALGGVLATQMYGAMSDASGYLQASNSQISSAMGLFFKPFGDAIGKGLLGSSKGLLGMATKFNKIATEDGLDVALQSVTEGALQGLGDTINSATGLDGLGADDLITGTVAASSLIAVTGALALSAGSVLAVTGVLTLGAATVLGVSGALELSASETLAMTGVLTIGAAGVLSISGSVGLSAASVLAVGGALTLSAPAVLAVTGVLTLTAGSVLAVEGRYTVPAAEVLGIGGVLTIGAAAVLAIAGVLSLPAATVLAVTGTLTIAAAEVLELVSGDKDPRSNNDLPPKTDPEDITIPDSGSSIDDYSRNTIESFIQDRFGSSPSPADLLQSGLFEQTSDGVLKPTGQLAAAIEGWQRQRQNGNGDGSTSTDGDQSDGSGSNRDTGTGPSTRPPRPGGNFVWNGNSWVPERYAGGMAEGGVVTGPTTATIGEAGTEAVLPLDRLKRDLEDAFRNAMDAGGNGSGGDLSALLRELRKTRQAIEQQAPRPTQRSDDRWTESRR